MDATRLWRLENPIRTYAWGSRTAIPALRGEAPTGEPQAELWMGAHPSASSWIETDAGTLRLDAWIRRDPESVLGAATAARFGPRLPFLFKVLAAERPLSLQTHPGRDQAREGFERENAAGLALDAPNRSYRDPSHKPELICALSPFRALCGFREPAEIEARFAALSVAGLIPLLEPLRRAPGQQAVAAFFAAWMNLDADTRAGLVDNAAAAARAVDETDPAYDEVVRLAESNPGDPGVLAPLFLNLVELTPGDAMFLPAGELHSYLGGTAVELMANSDNVLRGGLSGKFVDVPELLTVLTFRSGFDRLRARTVTRVETRYETPAEEFLLSVLRVAQGRSWESLAQRSAEIVLCAEGSVQLASERGPAIPLPRGGSVFAPAAAGSYRVEGEGTLYRASVGPPLV